MAYNYRRINYEVMIDTKSCYESIPELQQAVNKSVEEQFVVYEEDNIDQPLPENVHTKYIVSGKRSLEAAKAYCGKKVAVLNFANNHAIGGAPFSAGAQEESICRCSTLLPCLEAMKEPFYIKHRDQYRNQEIDFMGNDDLIYTPNVVVFKTDERTDPVYPKMMEREEWYNVNIITCAAPQLTHVAYLPANYKKAIESRIKKILDVAAKEGNEVVILGAWGCGAFGNPIEIVAKTFVELVRNYDFEIVEFALATTNDVRTSAFARNLQTDSTGSA